MTFLAAFRYYILLLTLLVFSCILLLPGTMKLDVGKKNICRVFSIPYEIGCARLPMNESIPIVVNRPNLTFSFFGQTFSRDLEFRYGLDVRGGSEVLMQVDMKDIQESDRDRALQSAREVIARRVDLYGLSESSVTTARTSDSYRLIATIPGITESDAVMNLIGSTAQLDFREYKPSTPSGTLAADPSATGSGSATPSGLRVADFVPTDLSGKDLSRASVVIDQVTSQPVIGLEFSPEGTKKLASLTKRNIGKPVAIFMDDYPVNAPTVQNEITDGRAQISGNFTTEEAQTLASTLNAGSLPAPLSVLSQRTVGATLGNVYIENSVRSGLIGIALVIVFLILLYGSTGVIGGISLLYYGVITLALYKIVPVTLSLPSIAGFLLSVGMAVDTQILVFERLREEEKNSRGTTTSVLSKAFSRAWGSIKDANGVTLISCFLLANPFDWSLLNTSGMIRGFALTLALGILLNLFTGMIVLRVLMRLFYRKREL